jgi:hypothetical protein
MKFLLSILVLCLFLDQYTFLKISLKNKNKEIDDKKIDYHSFRSFQMSKLQQKHTWYTAIKERMNDNFTTDKISQNRQGDEFISYLGFLKNSSYKANKVINEKKMEKFLY